MTVPKSLGLPAVPVWRWYFGLFTTRVGVEMDGQPEPGLVDSQLTSADVHSRDALPNWFELNSTPVSALGIRLWS
jgi:hypothetical protein